MERDFYNVIMKNGVRLDLVLYLRGNPSWGLLSSVSADLNVTLPLDTCLAMAIVARVLRKSDPHLS